jgi:hypothetical protein
MTVKDPKRSKEDDRTLASFIAPAIRWRWITEVHFFGCADDDDFLDASLLAATGASQRRHETIGNLVQAVEGRRLLRDIDLDVFNDAEVRAQEPHVAAGRNYRVHRCLDPSDSTRRRHHHRTLLWVFGHRG